MPSEYFQTQKLFLSEEDPTAAMGGEPTPAPTEDEPQVTQADVDKVKEVFGKRVKERDATISGLKAEAQSLRDKLAEIEAKERADAEAAETQANEAKKAKLLEQQKFEELLAQNQEEAAAAIAKKDQRIAELEQMVSSTNTTTQQALVMKDFVTEFLAAGGWEDQTDMIFPVYQKNLSYNFDSGNTEIINPATNEVMTDDHGQPYSLKTFVEAVVKEQKPSCFKSTAKYGTGADPKTGETVRGNSKKSFDDLIKMGRSQRVAYFNRG